MKNERIQIREMLFEFLAFWRGGVTARELAQVLGAKRETVQRTVIAPYKRRYAGNAVIRTRRTHIAGDANSLKASPRRVVDVVNFTSAMQAFAQAGSVRSPLEVPIEDVMNPLDSANEVEGLRALYGAIAHRDALYLDYAAKRGRLQMLFSAHALVRTASRVHVRGYAEPEPANRGSNRYIDILPGRIISAKRGPKERYVGQRNDTEWHQRVDIVATVSPALEEEVRESIMREHDCGAELRIERVRRAVARYVIEWLEGRRLHGIDTPIWTLVRIAEG